MQEIKITLPSGKAVTVPYGTRVSEIIRNKEFDSSRKNIIAAKINNKTTSLSYKIGINSSLKTVELKSLEGARIYQKSLSFLLTMASKEVFPERRLIIGHSLGDAYFYYFEDFLEVESEDIQKLEAKMMELVEKDIEIKRKVISYQEALDLFSSEDQNATRLIIENSNDPKVPIYECAEFTDLYHGPLAPSTGILKIFELKKYSLGFLLRYPKALEPEKLQEFRDNPVLFSVYREYKAWGKILDISSVGKLNEIIANDKIKDFIRVAEALHNKKISEIADKIFSRMDTIKVILVAGPSSSGKTTFTKKLAIQLQVMGFNPVMISLDDYFVPRELTPKDENGNYNFEALEAIDINLLNEHLLRLFKGEEIKIPLFDFKTGQRTEGKSLKFDKRNILILEGIHGLNDKLTPLISPETKYKVYVSALTQLNIDDHNRIPTTDNRLIRRMIRDYNFRGHSAQNTLKMWPSVRRGEIKNIFPFQNNADSAFNSALDYELSVLKPYAEKLLKTVKPFHEEYAEAIRLESFLKTFSGIPSQYVPYQSILREFIGDSDFEY